MTPPPIDLDTWAEGGERFKWRSHRIFYRVSGSGPALLLLHGFPTSGHDWAWVAPALEKHFTLIIPDMPDCGFSENPRGSAASVRQTAEAMDALLQSFGHATYHALGHDVGATIVQELIARQAERTAACKLLSACFLNGGLIPALHRPVEAQLKLASWLGPFYARMMPKERFLEAFANVFGAETRPTADELAMFWKSMMGRNGRGAIARRIRYIAERREQATRWVGALKGTTMPMAAIWGLDDPVSGRHMIEGLERILVKLRVTKLSGIGHYPQVEAPDAVVRHFLAFHKIEA